MITYSQLKEIIYECINNNKVVIINDKGIFLEDLYE